MPSAASPARRIAFLDSWYGDPAVGSGSTVGIGGLAGGLRRLGHQVDHVRPRGGSAGGLAARLRYNLTIARRLCAEDYDIVVGFDLDGCLLPRRDESRTGRRPPYVVALKGILADEARFETGLTRARLKALSLLERRNAQGADLTAVTSRYSREIAISRYGLRPDRVAVVPEGIELEYWLEPAPLPERDPPRILSVARQYPRKNTVTLLQAMVEVRERVPGAECRIVGAGPELDRLRSLAGRLHLETCVSFLGALPRDTAVRSEFRNATVFCLPSLQEGFGIVFLEAMASGLPIVASRDAAVPEVVPDGIAGILVDGRRPDAIASALIELLERPALRERLSRGGLETVRRYDWREVAKRFLAVAAAGEADRPCPSPAETAT